MNPKQLHALAKSTAFTLLFIGAITIYTEMNAEFKGWLKALAGHHWVAKGILSLVLFIALYYYFTKTNEKKYHALEMAKLVVACTILSGIAIFGYYFWHTFYG